MFRPASDLAYTRFLRRLHKAMAFDWYLEVGCRTGRMLQSVQGKAIAVDPFFQIELNVIGAKPAFLAFQQTSDAFFESGLLDALGARLGFSFLDGMHLFEFLLRDFMHAERASAEGAVIALHDCCPYDLAMTTRDLDNLPAGDWTGDVWKLIPILQHYRPDLEITVLGCKPTGLVLVSNLDPGNTALRDNYDRILADWTDMPLDRFGVTRFFDSFDYTAPEAFIAAGYPLFDRVRIDPAQLRVPVYITP